MDEAGDEHADAHEMLRMFLATRDIACPQCGYNLRMLTSDLCPECGEKLMLTVQAVDPKQAAPLAGLIGLSAGVGLNGLLLIYGIIVFLLIEGWSGDPVERRFMIINATGAIVLGILLYVWITRWRRIRRLRQSHRWGLVGACWALVLLDLIVFILAIR